MYNSSLSYIKSLGPNYRGDCPECGHKNTFVVNTNNGSLFWYCFHASCNLKGKSDYEISIDDIRNIYTSSVVEHDLRYMPPDHFVSPLQNPSCYRFLSNNNLLDFYSKHVDLIRYDPKQHRCVFILKDKEGIKGAVGRNLGTVNQPRWLIYARHQGCPFLLRREGNHSTNAQTLLLVEDAISASNASSIVDSCSLCGTNVPPDTIAYLVQYDRLVIALDDDALSKSIKLQKQLSVYRPTFIIALKKDVKYYNSLELEQLRKDIECLK